MGERLEPARARPVPFWRQGLAPPPRTMPRVLVAAVPWRRAACSARTASCTSDPWKRAPNAASSRLTVVAAPSVGASGIGTHLHDPVARARHGAADEHQVALGVQREDLEALLGDAAVTHLAGSLHALEDAGRRRRR